LHAFTRYSAGFIQYLGHILSKPSTLIKEKLTFTRNMLSFSRYLAGFIQYLGHIFENRAYFNQIKAHFYSK
jgi:hypothetical protein